jgi:hypothetical protein
LTRRLLVNGFAIEVSMINTEALEKIQGYDFTQLAGIDIRVVNENALNILKASCKINELGISLYSPKKNSQDETFPHFNISDNQALRRLNLYKIDLLKLLFDEEINQTKLQTFGKY